MTSSPVGLNIKWRPRSLLSAILGTVVLLPISYQWGGSEIFYIQLSIFCLFLLFYFVRHKVRVFTPLDQVVAVYLGWVIFGFLLNLLMSIFSGQEDLNRHRAFSLLAFFVSFSPYLVGRHYFSSERAVKDFINSMLITFSGVVFYFYYALFDFGLSDLNDARVVMSQRIPMIICFVAIIAGSLAILGYRMKIYLLCLWIFGSVLIILSLTRAVYIQWLVSSIIIFFLLIKRGSIPRLVAVALSLLLFFLLSPYVPLVPGHHIERIFERAATVYTNIDLFGRSTDGVDSVMVSIDESSSLRILMWRALLDKLSENPLRWLVGFGQLGASYVGPSLVSEAGVYVPNYSAHSEYVDVLIRAGGVGLVLIVVILSTVIFRGFCVSGRSEVVGKICFAHSIALVGVAFYGLFHEYLRYPIFGMYFWLYAGIVSSLLFQSPECLRSEQRDRNIHRNVMTR